MVPSFAGLPPLPMSTSQRFCYSRLLTGCLQPPALPAHSVRSEHIYFLFLLEKQQRVSRFPARARLLSRLIPFQCAHRPRVVVPRPAGSVSPPGPDAQATRCGPQASCEEDTPNSSRPLTGHVIVVPRPTGLSSPLGPRPSSALSGEPRSFRNCLSRTGHKMWSPGQLVFPAVSAPACRPHGVVLRPAGSPAELAPDLCRLCRFRKANRRPNARRPQT